MKEPKVKKLKLNVRALVQVMLEKSEFVPGELGTFWRFDYSDAIRHMLVAYATPKVKKVKVTA